jgi:hypothetical protein
MTVIQWKKYDFSETKLAIYYYIYVTFPKVVYSVNLHYLLKYLITATVREILKRCYELTLVSETKTKKKPSLTNFPLTPEHCILSRIIRTLRAWH